MNENFKILSFCSSDYVSVALNWVGQLQRLDITNYIIIAVDEDAYNKLKSKNIKTKLHKGKILKKSGTGWRYRFSTTYEYLKKSNILHSDLDV